MRAMDEFLAVFKETWGAVVAVGGGIGAVWKWRQHKKKEAENSSNVAFAQLEELKKKVILQIQKEIELAAEIAELKSKEATMSAQILELKSCIDTLKINCPDCFKTLNNE